MSGDVLSDADGSRHSLPTPTSRFGTMGGFPDADDLGDVGVGFEVGVGFDVAEPIEVDPTTIFEE